METNVVLVARALGEIAKSLLVSDESDSVVELDNSVVSEIAKKTGLSSEVVTETLKVCGVKRGVLVGLPYGEPPYAYAFSTLNIDFHRALSEAQIDWDVVARNRAQFSFKAKLKRLFSRLRGSDNQ